MEQLRFLTNIHPAIYSEVCGIGSSSLTVSHKVGEGAQKNFIGLLLHLSA